jgi:hypothetical protein
VTRLQKCEVPHCPEVLECIEHVSADLRYLGNLKASNLNTLSIEIDRRKSYIKTKVSRNQISGLTIQYKICASIIKQIMDRVFICDGLAMKIGVSGQITGVILIIKLIL